MTVDIDNGGFRRHVEGWGYPFFRLQDKLKSDPEARIFTSWIDVFIKIPTSFCTANKYKNISCLGKELCFVDS